MNRVNYNTTALVSSLSSGLPTMQAESRRLVEEAIAKHETFDEAARSLGIPVRALHRLRTMLGKTQAAKPKARKSKRGKG